MHELLGMRGLEDQSVPLLQYNFLTQTEAFMGPLSGALVHVPKRGNPSQLLYWPKRWEAKVKNHLTQSILKGAALCLYALWTSA